MPWHASTLDVHAEFNASATYGDTLRSIELPDGWKWMESSDEPVGAVGKNCLNGQEMGVAVTVSPATLTIESVKADSKGYTGTTDVTISDVTFSGYKNGDISVSYTAAGEFSDKEIGNNKKVTGKVTLNDPNYILIKDTFETTASILAGNVITADSDGYFFLNGNRTGYNYSDKLLNLIEPNKEDGYKYITFGNGPDKPLDFTRTRNQCFTVEDCKVKKRISAAIYTLPRRIYTTPRVFIPP